MHWKWKRGGSPNNLTLEELAKLLILRKFSFHREGGALVHDISNSPGERELTIEIHEPHETTTKTRDLWVYAPGLLAADSVLFKDLVQLTEEARTRISHTPRRVLDANKIGLIWSIPFCKFENRDHVVNLILTCRNVVADMFTKLAGNSRTGRRKLSRDDFDGAMGYPNGAPQPTWRTGNVAQNVNDRPLAELLSHAESLQHSGDYPNALAAYEVVLSKLNGASPTHLCLESKIRSQIVLMLHRKGPAETALVHALRAVAIDIQLHGSTHNDVAADLVDLAEIYTKLRSSAEATKCLAESRAVDNALLSTGAPSPNAIYRQFTRARVLQTLGYAEDAAHACYDAIPLAFRHLADNPELLVNALGLAADCVQDLGESRLAEDWLRQAITICQQNQSVSTVELGVQYSNLALALKEAGRFEEALFAVREALKYPYLDEGETRMALLEEIISEKPAFQNWAAPRSLVYDGETISHDVFLSYNSTDESLAQSLHHEAELLGLDVFTFREERDFPKLTTEIMLTTIPHLEGSRCLVLIGSATSFTSIYVYLEISAALKNGIPILAWYPHGTRISPRKTAVVAEDSPQYLMSFTKELFDPRVRSYYGFGLAGGSVKDLSLAILCRLLLMAMDHPLRQKYDVIELARHVRHPTRLNPIILAEDGEPLIDKAYRDVPAS